MKSLARHISKGLTRAAALAATGITALALACPALADESLLTEKYIAIEDCSGVGAGQFCPANPVNNPKVETQFTRPARSESFKVEFTANPNHCADMIAHVFIDGREWGSNVVHPGQSDGGYEIPVSYGLHKISIQAEGLPGGCNTGYVSAWGGMLRIWQLT